MARTLDVKARLLADDQLTKRLTGVAGAVMRTNKMLGNAGRASDKLMTNAQRLGDRSMGAGAVGAFGLAAFFSNAMEFDRVSRLTGAKMDLSTERLMKYRDRIAELARIEPKTRREIAEAGLEAATAGIGVDTFEQVMQRVAKASVVSMEEMPTVMGDVTDAINAMGYAFRDMKPSDQLALMKDYTDKLIVGTDMYNQKWSAFFRGFKHSLPVAKMLGTTFEEALIMQGELADKGLKGGLGGTGMRTALLRMVAGPKAARRVLASARINVGDFIQTDMKRLMDADALARRLAAGGFVIAADKMAEFKAIVARTAGSNDLTKLGAELHEFAKANKLFAEGDAQSQSMFTNRIGDHVMAARKGRFDVVGILKALKEADLAPGDVRDLFGYHRLAQGQGLIDVAHKVAERTDELVKKARKGRGAVMERAEKVTAGFWGTVKRLQSGLDLLMHKIENSGFLDDVADIIGGENNTGGVIGFVSALSDANPALMRFAGYAALAVVAMAPLGFVLSGAMRIIGPLAKGLLLLTGRMARGAGLAGNLTAQFGRTAVAAYFLKRGVSGAWKLLKRAGWWGIVLTGLELVWSNLGKVTAAWDGLKFGFSQAMAEMQESDAYKSLAEKWGRLTTFFKPLGVAITIAKDKLAALLGMGEGDDTAWEDRFRKMGHVVGTYVGKALEWAVWLMDKLTGRVGELPTKNPHAWADKPGAAPNVVPMKPEGPPNYDRMSPYQRAQRYMRRSSFEPMDMGISPGGHAAAAAREQRMQIELLLKGNVRGMDGITAEARQVNATANAPRLVKSSRTAMRT